MYSSLLLTVAVVLHKSLNAQDILEVEGVLGHSVELPCNVTAEKEDDRLNILAWYRNGSNTAFYSRDLRGAGGAGGVLSPGERYRLVAAEDGADRLQILRVRAADAGFYRCHADFAASPTRKTYVQLNVIEPPQKLWVIYENGTRVTTATMGSNASSNIGPFYVGDTIYLFCVAFEGKPTPTLSWWTGQRMLKNTATPLSEQRVRSDLRYGPLLREDHGRVFTCFARNNDKTPPLSVDVTVDMYLPPQLVSVRVSGSGGRADAASAGRVRADEPLALQCRVLGARPLPSVVWRLDDNQLVNLEQNTTVEPSQRLVVSEVQLSVTPELDEARVTCCAPAHSRDAEQFVCAAALPLTVLYPPVLQIVVEEALEDNTLAVVKGSNVSMNCSYQANPSVHQLTWFHEDDIMSQKTQSTVDVEPTLTLTSVSESDAGEYVCAAANDLGSTYSEPIVVDVTYPPFCEDETVAEYGVGENECLNLTCKVKGNPEPTLYHWLLISEVNGSKLRSNNSVTLETKEPFLSYERPNGTTTLIYCWGLNGIINNELQPKRCTFMVTDETEPRAPTNCEAVKNALKEITVTCEEGHDGGMQQKFKFTVYSLDSDEPLVSIINQEPKFMIQEPKQAKYKFVIIAFNEKGDSDSVDIEKDDIIDESNGAETISAVTNITTLALSLCGGVALLALAACGLVLCAHERGSRTDIPRALQDPPLCAYNTDDTCETFNESDEGSEFNVRRTESFRRAMAKYPPKNFDVRRTSSFHSARYLHEHDAPKCGDLSRHSASCRVHSLQNISRKREMDMLCDHLVMHLPPETSYNVPKPMNTFYTMPRKMRHKAAKEISDETSEITQNSDGFSLPPPPDEFGTYRAGTRIRDIPTKATPTYTTVVRHNNSMNKDPSKYNNNVIISPMNTVGLPSISGTQNSVYNYPDDDHQVNTNPFDDDSP